jgi:hypothetical protein
MAFQADDFEIELDGMILAVKVHTIANRTVFQIDYPDGRKPLMAMRMITFEGKKMWTSVPEGRLQEAQDVGVKIVEHFKRR